MVRLPSSVLQKSHKIQLVNASNEPRLDLHSPFLFFALFSVRLHGFVVPSVTDLLLIFGFDPLLSLSLESCSKTLVPIKHVDRLTRLQVSPEQDARVWQFPHCWYLTSHVIRLAHAPLSSLGAWFLGGIRLRVQQCRGYVRPWCWVDELHKCSESAFPKNARSRANRSTMGEAPRRKSVITNRYSPRTETVSTQYTICPTSGPRPAGARAFPLTTQEFEQLMPNIGLQR